MIYEFDWKTLEVEPEEGKNILICYKDEYVENPVYDVGYRFFDLDDKKHKIKIHDFIIYDEDVIGWTYIKDYNHAVAEKQLEERKKKEQELSGCHLSKEEIEKLEKDLEKYNINKSDKVVVLNENGKFEDYNFVRFNYFSSTSGKMVYLNFDEVKDYIKRGYIETMIFMEQLNCEFDELCNIFLVKDLTISDDDVLTVEYYNID